MIELENEIFDEQSHKFQTALCATGFKELVVAVRLINAELKDQNPVHKNPAIDKMLNSISVKKSRSLRLFHFLFIVEVNRILDQLISYLPAIKNQDFTAIKIEDFISSRKPNEIDHLREHMQSVFSNLTNEEHSVLGDILQTLAETRAIRNEYLHEGNPEPLSYEELCDCTLAAVQLILFIDKAL